MASVGSVFVCFLALLCLRSVNGQSITNLPNTIQVPENFEGTVFIVYADADTTFTVANGVGDNCQLQPQADCTTPAGSSCTLEYTSSNTPDFEALTPTQEACAVTADGSGDQQVLTVTVLNEDDDPPDTNCNPSTGITYDENDESIVGQLITTCYDDNPNKGFVVKFELSVDPASAASKFVIDEDNGEISWANGSLPLNNDHETNDRYTLQVVAYTPKQRDPSGHDVEVTIEDINEAPVITNLPQVVFLDEFYPSYTGITLPSDTDILTLTIIEPDDGGGTPQTHTASITDNSCPDAATTTWFKFVEEPAASGNYLKLTTDSANAQFDFESDCNEFVLSINVEDNGSPTTTSQTATLTVKVLDVQEIPWFNEFDSRPPGDSDLLTAYEVDFSYPDQAVTPANSRFLFNENRNPSIFINLDSSPATNANPAVATDGIYIADLSDYLEARQYYDPDCSPPILSTTCVATFQFKDPSIMEPFFEIRANPGTAEYYLYQVNEIDYETLCKANSWTLNYFSFHLNVVGVDNTGLETTNTVTLSMQLRDVNEYEGVMDETFNFSVNENAPFGTLVGNMPCEDLNDCRTDIIESFIIDGSRPSADNDGDYYFITSNAVSTVGTLSVLRPPDYEIVQQVQFNVYCVDVNTGGGSTLRKSATTLVTVTVIDQNDNEPELVETFFSIATRYDTEYRSYLTTLSATDQDSGLNALPIFSLGAYSDEFGIDSDTGDVFTQGQRLLPFSTYIIYGVVYDTGEPGQAQNIGNKMATIRIDTFDASAVLVDLYMGIDYANFNRDQFIMALEDLMDPYKFFIYELNGHVLKEDVVSNGVRASVYAIQSDVTLTETGLNQTKVFVRTEELLAAFREYADGTPSELFQSPQIISFGVRHVEATPISSDFGIEGEDESESWMVDTPEGNVVLALIVLLALFVLIGIVFAFYNFMRRLDCYRPSGEPNTFFPVRDADNKLHVGRINKKSVTALAREEKQVTAPTLDGPPNPPRKAQLQPVIPSDQQPKPTTVTSREGGRKIWEIKRSRELDGSANPLN